MQNHPQKNMRLAIIAIILLLGLLSCRFGR